MSFDALDLALALHAAPGRIDELRARPLPERGMAPLLRVALAQPDALADASAAFPADAGRLVDAARFYVEQQLLAREFDQDPWRVLGVNPDAAPELIRAHHHLLVRLVHPDRSDDWASAYADRVNRAWRQLRDADGRATALQHPPTRTVIEPWEARPATPRSATRADLSPVPAPRGRSQPLPWIAGGVALAVLAAVALQRLRPADEPPATPATVADATAAAPWYAETRAATPEPMALPAMVPIATLTPDRSAAPEHPAKAIRAAPSPASVTPAPVRIDPPVRPRTHTSVEVARTPGAEPPPEASVVAIADPVAVAAVADAAPPPEATALPSLDAQSGPTVLRHFRERYAQGDLSGLLRLYAREVHADVRRVAEIASDYTRLFNGSQQRYIDFSDMQWQQRDDRVVGRARYETGYRKRPSLRKHLERGEVELELVLDGAESRLRRFELRADRGR
ncbi:MAG: DnaJ domain-containing protein [Rhodanobacteraceae bacterium]|nr:DnaJ domain-containing protein [Rhodanobacteraceae bacterium]MBP6079374.1 DnaJ domain-containing protein [Xanthomonadales bacterium]MBP6693302.1 DnaJ domain-containing protein [Xanthomonadales bacterium]